MREPRPTFDEPGFRRLIDEHLLPYALLPGNISAGFRGYADSKALSHQWATSP